MHVPSDDELAAIAVAYAAAVVARRDDDGSQSPRASRWALSGRPTLEYDTAHVVAARTNRWGVAGRLSG